jgi:hypothetical protein
MISKLKSLTNTTSTAINAMSHNDEYKFKINKRNIFIQEAAMLLNEEITVSDTLEKAEEDEFPSYISILANNLSEKKIEITLNNMYKISQLINIVVGKMTNESYLPDIKDSVEMIIMAFEKNIKTFDINISDKLDVVESLKNVVQTLEYKIGGITEAVEFISHRTVMALIESITPVEVSVPDYVTIANLIIDCNTEQDVVKFIDHLPQFIESANVNYADGVLNIVQYVYRHMYSRLVLHVSALRKVADISEDTLGDITNEELKMTIQQFIDTFMSRANLTLEESDKFKYDVLMELGYDYIYDAVDDDKLLTETAVHQIKVHAMDAKRKLDTINKRASRKLDAMVQRVVEDHQKARKTAVEDKIMGSTIRASRLLKTILAGGGLAVVPTVGPVLSLIYLITKFCMSKKTEAKYRQMLMNDLIAELKIVQEKIKDADNNGDNKAKYRLMRIESQLQTAIDRIKFNYPM